MASASLAGCAGRFLRQRRTGAAGAAGPSVQVQNQVAARPGNAAGRPKGTKMARDP